MAHRHVDTRLEEAIEAVLVRYGIPAYGLRVRAAVADRGDLSSDLADAARSLRALPPEVAATAAAVKERLAAVTQGHWVAAIDIEPEDGGYWAGEEIIVVDEPAAGPGRQAARRVLREMRHAALRQDAGGRGLPLRAAAGTSGVRRGETAVTEWAIMRDGEIVNVCTTNSGDKPPAEWFPGFEIVDLEMVSLTIKKRYRYWSERP